MLCYTNNSHQFFLCTGKVEIEVVAITSKLVDLAICMAMQLPCHFVSNVLDNSILNVQQF